MLVKPHLTDANHRDWLSLVCGMSKRQVERIIAARCPRPDVPTSVRKIPDRAPVETKDNQPPLLSPPNSAASLEPRRTPGLAQPSLRRARIEPLSGSTYRVTFTATERLKAKLDRASELLSHSVQPGDLPTILERALDRLIELEERRRYGAARRCDASHQPELSPGARVQEAPTAQLPSRPVRHHSVLSNEAVKAELDPDPTSAPPPRGDLSSTEIDLSQLRGAPSSTGTAREIASIRVCEPPLPRSTFRHRPPNATVTSIEYPDVARGANRRRRVPASVRRAVFERDHGQCAFVDAEGRRCTERHFLEFDHVDALAVGGDSSVENVRLLCKWHNRLEAERLFGRPWVRRAIAHAKSR